MGNTSFLIRAQALGGKFLGEDINGFFLTVRDAAGRELFPRTHVNGEAGEKPAPTSYQAGASVATVVTPNGSPDPMVSWIVPDSDTVGQVVSFDIGEPTWVEVMVNGVTMDGSTRGEYGECGGED